MRVEKTVTIVNKLGLHARPATQLVKLSQKFDATCYICSGENQADASSVLGLMMLGSHQGQTVKVICEGADAQQALEAIEQLITQRFDEAE